MNGRVIQIMHSINPLTTGILYISFSSLTQVFCHIVNLDYSIAQNLRLDNTKIFKLKYWYFNTNDKTKIEKKL